MLYLHCISKENFIAQPRDLSCVELVCREVHVSFLDKMAERRVALLPAANGRHNVDVLFASESTPALVSLKTSCDFTVRMIVIVQKQCKIFSQIVINIHAHPLFPNFFSFTMTLIRELHLLLLLYYGILISFLHQRQLLFAQRKIANTEEIDETLPPLNLDVPSSCNCFRSRESSLSRQFSLSPRSRRRGWERNDC